jgi:hypothetical protein
MKAVRGSKFLVVLAGLSLVLGFTVSKAYCWAAATHAYIDDQLQRRQGLKNLAEIYAGMAPDIPNFLFGEEYQEDFYSFTHEGFRNAWEAAGPGKSSLHKAYAYGFASHNFADIPAHHTGLTYGQSEGYVVTRAKELLSTYPFPSELALPPGVALELAHNFVEYGIDLLIRGVDNQIGRKMSTAALMRNPRFPMMLVDAYAADLAPWVTSESQAAAIILTAEQAFRNIVIMEGQALMQDENTALELLSQQLAGLAVGYLQGFGIILPPYLLANLPEIVRTYLGIAMFLCADDAGNFMGEINATIVFVDQQLAAKGISYGNDTGGMKAPPKATIPNRRR